MRNADSGVSAFDRYFWCSLQEIGRNTKIVLDYMRAYRNYFQVLYLQREGRYPIAARLRRNGDIINLRNLREVYYTMLQETVKHGSRYDVSYDIPGHQASIRYATDTWLLDGAVTNGDVHGVFTRCEYDWLLPIKGKTVIDIGANIGDSALFFASEEASRVIALEPYPKNHGIALHNIKQNRLQDKITLLLAGCGRISKKIFVDTSFESDAMSRLKEFESGQSVDIYTLQDLVDKFHIENDAVLKIDCEGCEDEILLGSSKTTLQNFNKILTEYTFGYKNILRKLESSGFSIEARTGPERWITESGTTYSGIICARRE